MAKENKASEEKEAEKQPRFTSKDPPATPLRLAISKVHPLNDKQAEEFDALVNSAENGGWPVGKPAAVAQFREKYVEHGREWVTHEQKARLVKAAELKASKAKEKGGS